jgi:uncharacterized membrane protein
MYTGLFHGHSGLRYLVLVLLLVVIVRSIAGFLRNKPFNQLDNALSLGLLITTHIQFLLGLILYFVSPSVQFNENTMKDSVLRYWAVEHLVGMLIAVVLITIARSTAKRMTESLAKHKRLAIFNSIALLIIIATIMQSGRTVFFFF